MDNLLQESTDDINSEYSSDSNSSCSLREASNNSQPQSAIIYKELLRSDIENIIGMKPIDINKYRKAFVHKSVVKNAKESDKLPSFMCESYERYEFLGDSVLNLVVAKFLFHKFPNSHEGHLTKIRTKLVNGKTLAILANKLELGQFLILNYKVENINGRTNNRILEDVFESLICSIYLDLGFNYAEKFILDLIDKHLSFDELLIDDNYKDILLKYCQTKFGTTPIYKITETNGPPHNRTFKISCFILDVEYKYGRGKNKKEAEQLSSKETLKYFKVII
jgi:ribonuclease-3